MSRLRDWIAGAWASVRLSFRLLKTRVGGGLRHWLDPLAGSDEIRYRSPREMAVDRVAEEFDDPDSEFFVAPWEIPDVEDAPVELPPHIRVREEQFRSDLLAHIRRVKTRRRVRRRVRRRRTASFAGASLLTFALIGAGANALISGSTGVESVDAFLHLAKGYTDRDDGPGAVRRSSPRPNVRPSPESASEPLRLGRGPRPPEAVAYLSDDGRVCFVVSSGSRRSRPADIVGAMNCVPLALISRRVAAENASIMGYVSGRITALSGYAASNVTELRVTGPQGRLETILGKPWTPDAPNAPTLRPWVAVGRDDKGRLTLADENRAHDLGNYGIEADLANGQTVTVGPPMH